MSGAIEGVARTWLTDQPWQKVFKNTWDVVEDYVSYVLVSVGAISLSVRLLTTLGTGDVSCLIVGTTIEDENVTKIGELGPYPRGGTAAMINYAQTHSDCIRAVFTSFGEYLPYIMLLETLLLIIVEKFTLKIPRIAQRMERFYTNIVHEPLYGKDPDVTEDMTDPKTSTEATSRLRQRNEICVSLKRSSIIYQCYLVKNGIEILLISCIYLPLNLVFILHSEENNHAQCHVSIGEFSGVVNSPGMAHFQCHAKKAGFFQLAMGIQMALLLVHGLCSVGSIVWCKYFRNITKLLEHIKAVMSSEHEKESDEKLENEVIWIGTSKKEKEDIFEENDAALTGKDFLFLFDMLAHSCGIEITLRVLTHSDDQFYKIFKPNLIKGTRLRIEEDKLKVEWHPALAEKWLSPKNRPSFRNRIIDIDAYEVTIFPAEKVENTLRQAAKMKGQKRGNDIEAAQQSLLNENVVYSSWFCDLSGGTTEYVITIACIVGKSRMKGEKLVTNLVPYGAEKPRAGMVKETEGNPGTNQVEIFWEPPRGDFTKYVLTVDKIHDLKYSATELATAGSFLRMNSTQSKASIIPYNVSAIQMEMENIPEEISNPVHTVYNLNNKLQTYIILGLEPGEKYEIQLGTETGGVSTRQCISDIILTRPMPPKNVSKSNVTTKSCVLHWQAPDSHSCLKGFQIVVKLHSDIINSIAVMKTSTKYEVKGLSPGKDYVIFISSLCAEKIENRKTESIPVEVSVTTGLEKIRNLQLDTATTDSLTVKWDPETVSPNLAYKVTIESIKDDNVWDILFGEEDIVEENGNDEDGNKADKETSNLLELRGELREFTRTEKAISGEQKSHKFTGFPEGIGSGFPYEVEIVSTAKLTKDNKEKEAASSEPVRKIFLTKPCPPSKLRFENRDIKWDPSKTPHVTEYYLTWTLIKEDGNLVKDQTPGSTRIAVTKDNKKAPSFNLSKEYDAHFRGKRVFQFSVSAGVQVETLYKQILQTKSLEISGKFKVNEDDELEPYVDEQSSMAP